MHKLTIDFEEWFHPFQLRSIIPISNWNLELSRIEIQSKLLFNILDNSNTKATFFIVGWIAEFFPELINKIKSDGHEIAFHTYWHTPIFNLNRENLKLDFEKGLNLIYNITGQYPNSFRAPNFSIRKDTLWCLDILKEFGITNDSSYHFPFFHPDYGSKFKFELIEFEKQNIIEHPISILNIGRINFPFAGGAYFRYYPLEFTIEMIKKFQNEKKEVIFYFHPWELDNNLPKINLPFFTNLRLRYNIKNNLEKLDTLLNTFNFEPLNT